MNRKWTDEEVLHALDLRERVGLSASKVAEMLSREWRERVTKSQVIGATCRALADHKAQSCLCRKHENKDGGMPSWWWVR